MSSSERKPFNIDVVYQCEQTIVVYAETLADALDIAGETAGSGELKDYAPEESMRGGDKPQKEWTVDGGYPDGGPVKIMIGAVHEDVPQVSEASHVEA